MGIIGVIGTVTLMHVFLWFACTNRRHGSVDANPPLLEHDQLGGDHLRIKCSQQQLQ